MLIFEDTISQDSFIMNLLNTRNFEGKSPLYLCIENGREQMFDMLIDRFADYIDFYSKLTNNGWTALH